MLHEIKLFLEWVAQDPSNFILWLGGILGSFIAVLKSLTLVKSYLTGKTKIWDKIDFIEQLLEKNTKDTDCVLTALKDTIVKRYRIALSQGSVQELEHLKLLLAQIGVDVNNAL